MENAIMLLSVFMLGFIIGLLCRKRPQIEYINSEKIIHVTPEIRLTEEQLFLNSTIVFESDEFSQKGLMLHLKHIGSKVSKAKNEDKFFVRIPDYPSPIAINYFSYKFFKTIK